MNNRKTFGLAVVLASAGSLFSQATPAVEDADFRLDTTARLHAVCSVGSEAAEYAVAHQACRAFLQATVQYHDEISARRKLKRLVCYPKGATIEDGSQAFLSWGDAHAKDARLMTEPPVVGVVRALAAKYPCQK